MKRQLGPGALRSTTSGIDLAARAARGDRCALGVSGRGHPHRPPQFRVVVVSPSQLDHAETVQRLIAAITRRGMTLFARIDHAAAAREVGLKLADEQVLVFGNPKAGTALMQSDPKLGIELPLRMLVWNDGDGVLLGYNDPRELAGRYTIEAHHATLDAMAELLAGLATEAAG